MASTGIPIRSPHPCIRQTDEFSTLPFTKKRNETRHCQIARSATMGMGGREFITNPILTCVCGLVDQNIGGSAWRGTEQAGCEQRVT